MLVILSAQPSHYAGSRRANEAHMSSSALAARPQTVNPLRGVLLVLAAVFIFACMDSTTKHLATLWNVPLVVAVRYIGNLIVLTAVYAPRHGTAIYKTNRTGLVMLRALCLATASLFAGLALTRMPVAETVSIIFTAPFVVMILAIPLLGEKVAAPGWIAAIAGFCGVLLVVRPGSGLDGLGVLYALACASVTVGYYLLSRLLAKTESTMAMLFHTALIGTVLFCAYLPWSFYGPAPGALDFALFIAIGVMAAGGHFLFTAAFRQAPASFLAPVNYFHLLWAALLGWLIFDHVPTPLSLAGMALIGISGAATAVLSSRKTSTAAAPVETDASEV
jgi:drug/metabolite transporter (DMT)-like permease